MVYYNDDYYSIFWLAWKKIRNQNKIFKLKKKMNTLGIVLWIFWDDNTVTEKKSCTRKKKKKKKVFTI